MTYPLSPSSDAIFDLAMPALALALDADRMQLALQEILRASSRDLGDVELDGVRLLRHKPGRRALIEYQLSCTGAKGTEPLTLLGKMRAKGLDRKTPTTMEELRRAGFDADSVGGVSVPTVIGEVPELAMWLQEKVPGLPLTSWPIGSIGVPQARRVAEAACQLHRAGVKPMRSHTVDNELRILRERFDRLATEQPPLAPRLEHLLTACAELAEPLRQRPRCGIHRDFYPAQMLADGDRLWLLDFDLYCEGDPALDFGNFIGHLTEQALREHGDAEAFAESEQAMEARFVELTDGGSRHALRAWQTLTLARHVSISTQFAERRPFTKALLRLCEHRLKTS